MHALLTYCPDTSWQRHAQSGKGVRQVESLLLCLLGGSLCHRLDGLQITERPSVLLTRPVMLQHLSCLWMPYLDKKKT